MILLRKGKEGSSFQSGSYAFLDGGVLQYTPTTVIVILSEAKNLSFQRNEILHFVQDDHLSPTAESSFIFYWILRSRRRMTVDDGGPCSVMTAYNILISFIDQPGVIKAILQHIGLWVFESRPPPKNKAPPSEYYAAEQIPVYDCVDPDYPFEAYL
jgi:hypothetical protein